MLSNQYIGIEIKVEILSLSKISPYNWEKVEMKNDCSKYNHIVRLWGYIPLSMKTSNWYWRTKIKKKKKVLRYTGTIIIHKIININMHYNKMY